MPGVYNPVRRECYPSQELRAVVPAVQCVDRQTQWPARLPYLDQRCRHLSQAAERTAGASLEDATLPHRLRVSEDRAEGSRDRLNRGASLRARQSEVVTRMQHLRVLA